MIRLLNGRHPIVCWPLPLYHEASRARRRAIAKEDFIFFCLRRPHPIGRAYAPQLQTSLRGCVSCRAGR